MTRSPRPWGAALIAALASGCSHLGDAPSWWWNDPIQETAYCDVPSWWATKGPAKQLMDLESSAPVLRRCYDELLSRIPEAAGTLEAEVTVAENGAVRGACLSRATTLRDATAARCMLVALQGEPFAGGEPRTERVHLIFTPEMDALPYRPMPRSSRDHDYPYSSPNPWVTPYQ